MDLSIAGLLGIGDLNLCAQCCVANDKIAACTTVCLYACRSVDLDVHTIHIATWLHLVVNREVHVSVACSMPFFCCMDGWMDALDAGMDGRKCMHVVV